VHGIEDAVHERHGLVGANVRASSTASSITTAGGVSGVHSSS
jgi:hypothetical protein